MNNTTEHTEEEIDLGLTPREQALELIQTTINNISRTNNTPSSDIVDVLLDLQQAIKQISDTTTGAMKLWMHGQHIIDWYAETYGPADIPEGWEPAWRTEDDI
jgi:hypothetical protein